MAGDTQPGPDAALPLRPIQHNLPDELLVFDVDDAAQVLAISRASIYRRVRNGEFPHRRLGSGTGIRFTLGDLRAILDAAAVPPSEHRGQGT